ncbi:hypothetical protein QVD17_17719 [Tagetes erecta]|uniref:Calmodulin-binding domain-containing protein n=1 Tax=Tagetes erecta TaxID=13708 RepID=A0AAD8KSS7_TARER|nr:hypothetical protein QVD17_17719 [Tagetes erecta]
MAIESSLTQEIGEIKKPQLDCMSPQSSLTQGDSDSESTSVSSSMQGSISSATSSLDQYSSNVKQETRQKKPPNKSVSRNLTSFGSFMTSRRRAQSKLSRSSIALTDDGSNTPVPSSSIEVSDESSSHVQKPMPKFTRTGSLRSVKIFRTNSKNKNKNKSNFKSKNSSTNNFSQSSEDSHSKRATFSSILKDSKFPEQLKHQSTPSEPEEVLAVAKICPYQHCSLHGHHHHHEPPKKRFPYLKRRSTNDQKIVKPESQPKSQTAYKRSGKKREMKGTKMGYQDVDSSIEFYDKTRSEPVSSHDHGDAEAADILFGITSFQEKKNEIPISNNRDLIDLINENDENSNGSKRVLEKEQSLKETNHISMWHMIHQHMLSGLAAEPGDETFPQADEDKKSETKDFDDDVNQETEIRKMFAIKLVRDAIEKILLPEVQDDDQSTTSEVIPEQDTSEQNEITSDRKEESPAPVVEEKPGTKTEKGAPDRWSYLKKVILLTKFVRELEKVKRFNPKKPRQLPVQTEPEAETVSLRRQVAGEKKNSDEWMLDYALQKVVSELAPTQKRKVALLVKAFETVAPAQDESPDPKPNDEIESVGSEPEVKLEQISESKSSLERETHIKMWHMIYQHVVTDIATKIGSDLLTDGEESSTGEEKNLREVEDKPERNNMLQFTQSDALKLVRESVDEILLPDIPDNSSQDTRSTASDIASEQEETSEKKDGNSSITKLQSQTSKNWGKLKKLITLKRSIKALEGFRNLKSQTPQREILKSDQDRERVDLRRQMMDERKKAEQWMLDYAVQHIVTKLTPARKKRVSMLVEAFEAVVPFPEI